VQGGRVRVAQGWVDLEQAADDVHQRRRHLGAEQIERRVLGRLHAPQRLLRGRRGKRVRAADHLVEHRAQREEVAAAVERPSAGLLRAHVRRLAADAPNPCVGGLFVLEGVLGLGDAEVGDLHLSFPGEQDVLRGDVAVHDSQRARLLVAAAVRVIERLGHLGGDVDRQAEWQRLLLAAAAGKKRGEVEPRHVLHGHEVGGGLAAREVDAAEVEHLDDVRVREAHRELGLVHEEVDEALVLGQARQDALDDQDLLEALDTEALGLEDLGHAALAEALEQSVSSEGLVQGTGNRSSTVGDWRVGPSALAGEGLGRSRGAGPR
jgi:hypothetical protein